MKDKEPKSVIEGRNSKTERDGRKGVRLSNREISVFQIIIICDFKCSPDIIINPFIAKQFSCG